MVKRDPSWNKPSQRFIDFFAPAAVWQKLLFHDNEFTTRHFFLPALTSKWATCSGFTSQEDQPRQHGLFHFQQMSGEAWGGGQQHTRGFLDSSFARDHQGDRLMKWQATFLSSLPRARKQTRCRTREDINGMFHFILEIGSVCLCDCVWRYLHARCHLHSICPLYWNQLKRGWCWSMKYFIKAYLLSTTYIQASREVEKQPPWWMIEK